MAVPLETVLRLDDREYNAKLAQAEGKANIFANKFQKSFVSAIGKFAGVTMMARFVQNVIASREEIVGLGEDSKTALENIENGFKAVLNAVKLTTAQIIAGNPGGNRPGENHGFLNKWVLPAMGALIQRDTRGLQAFGAGFTTNEEMAKAADAQGKQARAAQAKQIKELQELASKLADENMLAGMTIAERRKELQMRLEALRKPELIRGMSMVEKLENAIAREQLKSQLMGLSKIPTANLPKPKFGALTEVGGFLGRTDNARLVNIQDAAVRHLAKIEKNTNALNKAETIGLD